MAKSGGGSKADTMFKLVLIFFISLLSFSVGTYVGKQVSDSDYRRASIETDFNGKTQVAANADDSATADSAANDPATKPITDEQTASLSEEYIKEQRKPSSVDQAAQADATATAGDQANANAAATTGDQADSNDGYTPRGQANGEMDEQIGDQANANQATANQAAANHVAAAQHAPQAASGRDTASISKAADRVAHNMAPTMDQKKSPHHSTALPTVATSAVGKYTVQIASYATEREAKLRAQKLVKKGYSAFYVPAVVKGHKWFRVSVGLFADQKGATDYRTELLSTKAVASAIVQKIVK